MSFYIVFHDRGQSVFKCPDDNLGLLCHNGTMKRMMPVSWIMIKVFFYFFAESQHDFKKFLPVKQQIKKVWLYCYIFVIKLF